MKLQSNIQPNFGEILLQKHCILAVKICISKEFFDSVMLYIVRKRNAAQILIKSSYIQISHIRFWLIYPPTPGPSEAGGVNFRPPTHPLMAENCDWASRSNKILLPEFIHIWFPNKETDTCAFAILLQHNRSHLHSSSNKYSHVDFSVSVRISSVICLRNYWYLKAKPNW